MLSMMSQLEHKIEDKVFHFVCAPDCPLPMVKEALFQFLKFVGSIEDKVKAEQEAMAAQAAAAALEANPTIAEVPKV